MNQDEVNKKIDFVMNILEHNYNLITLIDAKAGLILGTSGIILGLLSFFDQTTITGSKLMSLFFTIGLFALTIIFSFITIFPRITKKTKSETTIFYTSITKQSKEDYRKIINDLTPQEIINDYSDNIYSITKIHRRKIRSLQVSLSFMMLSILSLVATLYLYFI